jgi:hypothetical protein
MRKPFLALAGVFLFAAAGEASAQDKEVVATISTMLKTPGTYATADFEHAAGATLTVECEGWWQDINGKLPKAFRVIIKEANSGDGERVNDADITEYEVPIRADKRYKEDKPHKKQIKIEQAKTIYIRLMMPRGDEDKSKESTAFVDCTAWYPKAKKKHTTDDTPEED